MLPPPTVRSGPGAHCPTPSVPSSRAMLFRRSVALAPVQKEVGRTLARDDFRALIAQGAHVDVVPEVLPATQQDRPQGEMQLINKAGAQILTQRGHPATEAHVLSTRSRLLQGGLNASRDEMKLGAARHLQRRARMVGQHEDGRVIRRLLTPPTPPALVRPRAAHRSKHVAAKN